ncbi:MAG: type II secretion system F family protein [Acidimicrobiales bacterium]
MSAAVSVLCGLAVAVGLWLLIQAALNNVVVAGRSSNDDGSSNAATRRSGPRFDSSTALFALVGGLVAVAILATTRLVVVAGAAGLAVIMIPRVIQAKRARTRAIAKMRAASEFVESIRGSLGAGSGLEAAIVESAMRPPEALEDELAVFVEYSRQPEISTEQALRHLANDAGEPAIDLLVGSLLAALKGAAGDMGQLFERIAEQGRSFAETRAHTQAERAKVEFQTKVLSLLVVGVSLLSIVVSPDLTSAYDATAVGQFRLLIPVVVFGFGWWWLTKMNMVESMYRFRLRPVRADGVEGR